MIVTKHTGEFIFNNGYLTKLITNKTKHGNKGLSLKLIYSFIFEVHHNQYLKKKKKIRLLVLNLKKKKIKKNILLKLIVMQTAYSSIMIINKNLTNKVDLTFGILKPIIFINKVKTKRATFVPILKRSQQPRINKAIHIFLKYALVTKVFKKFIPKLLTAEYIRVNNYKSKCIKEKFFQYKVLSNNFYSLLYKYKK
jgi:hypothetical protein